MSSLEQLQHRIDKLEARLREVSKPDRDVVRLSEWLEADTRERSEFQELSWLHVRKWQLAARLFFKGHSKSQHERWKKFQRWQEKRAENLKQVREELRPVQAQLRDAPWESAMAKVHAEPSTKPVRDFWASQVDLVLMDYQGDPEAIQTTLQRSREAIAAARSVSLVTAFELPGMDNAKLQVIQVDSAGGYMGLFEQLDQKISHLAESPGVVGVLECGSVLAKPMEIPQKLQSERGVFLPGSVDLKTQKVNEPWGRDEWLRKPLFPMTPPCLFTPSLAWKEEPYLFQHFLHLAPWHLILSALGNELESVHQSHEITVIGSGAVHCLSAYNRAWLKQYRPELLQELRSVPEEWDLLLHDLVVRVVSAHPEFFANQVGYLAAAGLTGIHR